MIKKISTLKNFGRFHDFAWSNPDLEFKEVNMIYGYNGSGKTTISILFSLLSAEADEDQRNDILQKHKNDVNKDISFELLTTAGKIKDFSSLKKIFVFNSYFVSEHVFEGHKAKVKDFKGGVVTRESLQDSKIKDLNNKVKANTEEKVECDKQLMLLADEAAKVFKVLSSTWNKNIEGKRLPTGLNLNDTNSVPISSSQTPEKELDDQLAEHFRRFKASKKAADLLTDIDILKNKEIAQLAFPDDILLLLNQKVSEEAYNKIENKLAQLKQTELVKCSHQDWLEEGQKLLKGNVGIQKCPLCDSDLPNIKRIIKDYSDIFNDEFSALQKNLQSRIETLAGMLELIINNKEIATLTSRQVNKYGLAKIIGDEALDLLNTYDDKIAQEEINTLKAVLEYKLSNLTSLSDDKDRSSIDRAAKAITSLNDVFVKVNLAKDRIISELSDSKFNDQEAKQTSKDLFWKRFDEQGGEIANAFLESKGKPPMTGLEFFKALQKKSDVLSRKHAQLEKERNEALAKLKKESEYVNHFLKHLSVNNYEIKINESLEDENIEIIYKTGKIKKGAKYSLSDGERTSLAFAYFLSKIKHEVIENTSENMNEYAIVIDDPISSLDDNRLFSTAVLIKNMFTSGNQGSGAKQLFVFSHNLIFLKFLGNILNKKSAEREDFFIGDGTLIGLPKVLQNYQTSYFYKIQKIIDFINGDVEYEQAKDYIPNCIRTVLETFLAFKLCILKQGSSGEKYKPAGLDKLINSLSGVQLNKFEDRDGIKHSNVINYLWEIKKKVDPDCHGTAQDMTDFEYIPETVLRDISKLAISIIGFFDGVHLDRIKSVN